MKHTIFYIIILYYTITIACGQASSQISQYLNSVITNPQNSNPDDWNEADRGGYLYRFTLDHLGPKGPYLFLCTSLEVDKGWQGSWAVFYNKKENLLPFNLKVGTFNGLFLAPSDTPGICDVIEYTKPQREADPSTATNQERTQNRYDRYHFLPPKIQITTQYVSEDDAPDFDKKINMKETSARIEVVLISEYLKNPSVKWTELKMEIGDPEKNFIVHNGYLHLKGDLVSQATRPSFSREDALSLIKKNLASEK